MRVLVATRGLVEAAGSETYVETLAAELLTLGHEVTCFAPRVGEFGQRLRQTLGVTVIDDARHAPEPDVIHASHVDSAALAMTAWPLVPAVYVVHGLGTRGVVERPPTWRGSIERWVAVSERVADAMVQREGLERADIHVIPNFVDVQRFAPITPVRSPAHNVLVVTNHLESALGDLVVEACRLGGFEPRFAGGQRRRYDMVSELNLADVVITIGRGAIEAMACARPVVVLSPFGGDGVVTPESAKRALATNYSGLGSRTIPTAGELVDQLGRCTADLGAWSREWVIANHDARVVVPRLVDLYEDAIAVANEQRESRGDVDLLAQRLGAVYPSLRWWYGVPQEFDAIRAAWRFPLWAPDADEELEPLLAGLQAEHRRTLERAAAGADQLRIERDAALARLAEIQGDLDATRATLTWRLHDVLASRRIIRLVFKMLRRT